MNDKKISNASCPACGFGFSDNTVSYLLSEGRKVKCPCGERTTIGEVALGFVHGAKVRSTVNGAKSRIWWHATLVDDWFNKVKDSNSDVHIGQKSAAFDRLKCLIDGETEDIECHEEFTGFHVWTVAFDEDASFVEGLQEDAISSWDETHGLSVIYLNRWESPGSVSVHAPVSSLRAVSHRMVTKSELYSHPSLYNNEPVPGILL